VFGHIVKGITFLMVSFLLVGCASQKSITPYHAVDINPPLNIDRPVRTVENLMTEKPAVGPLTQPTDAKNELKPAKEAGAAIEQTPAFKTEAEPMPEKVSMTLCVRFDTGKANIKPKDHDGMKRIADFMDKYPSTSALIEGHTDNVGKVADNVKLSYRRAANVKKYLVEKFGVESSRIRAIGYDDQKPIASNKTAEGRQKNRRSETKIETNVSPNRLYSLFEDSDLPKGGFSIVNQESIDEKIKSFKEKRGAAAYASKIVKEPKLQLYKMWGGIFSHCAIRIETAQNSFYQIELQSMPDLQKAAIKDYHQIGAAIRLWGMIQDKMDIVEFTDKNERKKLDDQEPPYATMPICTGNKAAVKSTQWYQECLSRYAGSYNPENALQLGKRTKVFEYEPITHNCCNFTEEALKACGLAHCFDLGKSTGLDHKTGPLEE